MSVGTGVGMVVALGCGRGDTITCQAGVFWPQDAKHIEDRMSKNNVAYILRIFLQSASFMGYGRETITGVGPYGMVNTLRPSPEI